MITYDEALSQLRVVVAMVPDDHVYELDREFNPENRPAPRCLYVHNQRYPTNLTFGCIIGAWLHRFGGMSWAHIATLDGIGTIASVAEHLPFKFSPKALYLMHEVQQGQDNGRTWRNALYFGRGNTEAWCASEYSTPRHYDADEEI